MAMEASKSFDSKRRSNQDLLLEFDFSGEEEEDICRKEKKIIKNLNNNDKGILN